MKPRLRKYGRFWHCFWPNNIKAATKLRARGVGYTPYDAWVNWCERMREHFTWTTKGRS